jgi:deoxyribodipyrimidine photo-lyase
VHWNRLYEPGAAAGEARIGDLLEARGVAARAFNASLLALQGRKFDPGGAYVRRWIPELADLPRETDIHAPRAEGHNGYPPPIVDHARARAAALAAFRSIRTP